MKTIICLLLLASTAVLSVSAGFGTGLIRSAGNQHPLPVTTQAASSAGWKQSSKTCVPGLGFAWNNGASAPTNTAPITLYFAANGQISGFGTDVFGTLPASWTSRGYYAKVGSSQYRIQAATRPYNEACGSTAPFPDVVGDRIVINPSGINQTLPANEQQATAQQWSRGACISGMGRHWEFDFASAPVQSYNTSNFLPVVPMYDVTTSNLNAIFFASTDVQQGMFDTHMWDVVPIPGALMCKNFCGSCKWATFSLWSTMHIWFGSTTQNCPSSC